MADTSPPSGRYTILEPLGEGGFATVYRALDSQLNREVALKLLHRHFANDPSLVERFKREAKAAAQLDHPHIVTIFDWGEFERLPYIVMRFLPGQSVEALLAQRQALSLSEALPLLAQMAQALDYAHARGYVHRDVKPLNAIVDERGHLTLTDFGLAKAMEPGGSALTMSGQVMGTPEYMAPEQADARLAAQVGPATDLYSFGIVAYRMLTGRVPFPGSGVSTLFAHVNTPPPDPRSLRADLPPLVGQILLRALAKEPGRRFASASAFVEALRAASAGQAALLPSAPTEVAPVPLAAAAPTQVVAAAPPFPPPEPMTRRVAPVPMPVAARRAGPPGWMVGAVALALLLCLGISSVAYFYGGSGAVPATPTAQGGVVGLPPTATSSATEPPPTATLPGATAEPSVTESATAAATESATATATESATPLPSATLSATATPSATPIPPTPTATPSATPIPPTPTATPSATASATAVIVLPPPLTIWEHPVTVVSNRHIFTMRLSGPGQVRVRATWSGDQSEVALILNGPGQAGFFERVDGSSPLELLYEVTPADFAAGDTWRLSVASFGAGSAQGSVRLEFPGATEGPLEAPFVVQPDIARATDVLVLGGPGPITGRATWSGSPPSLALIVNGPGQVPFFAREDGPSPLLATYTVSPADFANGPYWLLSLASVGPANAEGTLRSQHP